MKHTAWIIYSTKVLDNKYGNFAFEWMREAGARSGFEVEILFSEHLSLFLEHDGCTFFNGSEKIDQPDCVLMRCYDFELSQQLELLNIPVFNSTEAMRRCRNKLTTHQLLHRAGVEQPKTFFSNTTTAFHEICSHLNSSQFIIKGLEGSQGKEVFIAESETSYLRAANEIGGAFLTQEFIENSRGTDIRVYVVGKKILGCIKRTSNGGFRSNYAQGAGIELFEKTVEIENIVQKTQEVIGYDFAGLDLLFGKEGLLVCEINGNAGFRTISQLSNQNLPRAMFKHIAATLK